MHPHLQDMPLDADRRAELLHGRFVVFLDAPTELLCKRTHLILLLCRKFRPESLLDRRGGPHGYHHATGTVTKTVVLLVAVGETASAQCSRRQRCHSASAGRERQSSHWGRCVGPAGQLVGCDNPCTQLHTRLRLALTLAQNFAFDFSTMEVPVAVAGRAPERAHRTFLATGHKLPATIEGVSTNAGCMVLLALPVPEGTLLHI